MANEVDFYVAEANAAEAAGTIGELATRRGLDPQVCQEAFLSLMEVVQIVDTTWIETARDEALTRIRDPADWPALALALQLECAIWTAVVRNDQSAAHERVLLSPFLSRDHAAWVNPAMVLVSLAADQLSASASTRSAVSPEPSGPGLKQDLQRSPA